MSHIAEIRQVLGVSGVGQVFRVEDVGWLGVDHVKAV